MVKILKHGKHYLFHCTTCGCKWIAGVREIRPHMARVIGDFGYMECPDCGAMTKGVHITEASDGDPKKERIKP